MVDSGKDLSKGRMNIAPPLYAKPEVTMSKKLLEDYKRKLRKALDHLEYSSKKIQKFSLDHQLGEEELETMESYTARMSRVSDIFVTKYLRLLISYEDPAFEGSVRDICNFAEKMRIIDKADTWLEIRSIRNTTAHEYEEADLLKFWQRSKQLGPIVIKTVRAALK